MRILALPAIAMTLCAGCASTLERQLGEHGVSYESCGRLELVGSESLVLVRVTLTPADSDFQNVWTSILQARPFDVWFASGYISVEFYITDESASPVAVLLVNASGAAHLKGSTGPPERFYCPGLHDLMKRRLLSSSETAR